MNIVRTKKKNRLFSPDNIVELNNEDDKIQTWKEKKGRTLNLRFCHQTFRKGNTFGKSKYLRHVIAMTLEKCKHKSKCAKVINSYPSKFILMKYVPILIVILI